MEITNATIDKATTIDEVGRILEQLTSQHRTALQHVKQLTKDLRSSTKEDRDRGLAGISEASRQLVELTGLINRAFARQAELRLQAQPPGTADQSTLQPRWHRRRRTLL